MSEATRGVDPIRIGIHTGVMVTDAGGLLGGVPDQARDCMLLAAPGVVVISAETERIVRGWFDSRPVATGETPAAGLPYVIEGARPDKGRMEWLAGWQRLTPLTGREVELQQRPRRVDAVRRGQGQLMTLRGEPGIGKSRLVWELKRRVPEDVRWLEVGCSPYFQNTNLYPVVGLLEQFLGFREGDDALTRRDKLAAALADAGRMSRPRCGCCRSCSGCPPTPPQPRP